MNTARMNPNTHIQFGYTCNHSNQVYGFYHVETHLNCTWSVIGTCFGKTRDTIVTISKQFYTKTMIICSKTIKSNKQFVKSSNNFCWNTLNSYFDKGSLRQRTTVDFKLYSEKLSWEKCEENHVISKLTWDANFVKPTISANKILKYNLKFIFQMTTV